MNSHRPSFARGDSGFIHAGSIDAPAVGSGEREFGNERGDEALTIPRALAEFLSFFSGACEGGRAGVIPE